MLRCMGTKTAVGLGPPASPSLPLPPRRGRGPVRLPPPDAGGPGGQLVSGARSLHRPVPHPSGSARRSPDSEVLSRPRTAWRKCPFSCPGSLHAPVRGSGAQGRTALTAAGGLGDPAAGPARGWRREGGAALLLREHPLRLSGSLRGRGGHLRVSTRRRLGTLASGHPSAHPPQSLPSLSPPCLSTAASVHAPALPQG